MTGLADDQHLLAQLRAGDEDAFTTLVRQHHGALRRFVRTFVASLDTADEVVQETWLAVLTGLSRFEGRSSLRSWIFSIAANQARRRAVRDGRTILFSDLGSAADDDEPAVDPSRFNAAGYWHQPPRPWDDFTPERLAASQEIRAALEAALDELPPAQRTVVMLRDVAGCTAAEACNILGISETNQRVLLHRGRARLRRLLEPVMERR